MFSRVGEGEEGEVINHGKESFRFDLVEVLLTYGITAFFFNYHHHHNHVVVVVVVVISSLF